jgi:hypothetical protein
MRSTDEMPATYLGQRGWLDSRTQNVFFSGGE